jgi:hypothetical protein
VPLATAKRALARLMPCVRLATHHNALKHYAESIVLDVEVRKRLLETVDGLVQLVGDKGREVAAVNVDRLVLAALDVFEEQELADEQQLYESFASHDKDRSGKVPVLLLDYPSTCLP